MKKCSKCKIEKNESDFRISNPRTGNRGAYCFECQRSTSRQHYADNQEAYKKRITFNRNKRFEINRKLYQIFKEGLYCTRCGEDHVATLDFHHSNPKNKEQAVSVMLYDWSWSSIMKEIQKCEVLCSNCHRKLHYNQKHL